MADVYLALGSNLGDRAENLAAAREALARGVVTVAAASSICETEPWGPKPQGPYLNQVLRGTTALSPRELLARLMQIERALGRNRAKEERYGPRTLDLDILLYGDAAVREPDLVIPHPRMMERPFVLVPLAEIAPDLAVGGVRVREALARLDTKGVVPYRQSN
ncbi:MAG: 2-amino-4-hydroxy-6-hydroxymethyldihydropteridine diphosphokinase [Bradyrhizobiaceae bacterium]|nr:2-amino-4-hydroxy-6-hydroxymethyldihydropteridine diphosphokinase [Bradyrhizobiaceae bacterium]